MLKTKGGCPVAVAHNHLLSFSVGELPCQLLQIASGSHSVPGPPTSYFTHKHSFVEMHYIMQGRCSYTAEKSLHDLAPGQLLIIPPGMIHMLTQVHSTIARLVLSLHIQPPPSQAQGPSRALYDAFHVSAPLVLDVPPESTLAEALSHIVTLSRVNEQSFSVRESLRAYTTLLMAALSESLIKHPVPDTPPSLSAPQSFLIEQFFGSAYMDEGAPALAQMLGVGTRQLDRILLDQFGMNFREKLNHTKLNYAVQLLSNRALSIEQVAHLLGYSTATAFGTFIKKETGQTPTQLRRAIWSKPHSP